MFLSFVVVNWFVQPLFRPVISHLSSPPPLSCMYAQFDWLGALRLFFTSILLAAIALPLEFLDGLVRCHLGIISFSLAY